MILSIQARPSKATRVAAGLALLAALAACGGAGTSVPTQPTGTGDHAYVDTVAYSTAANASLASADEHAAVTHHQVSLGGQALAYVATAGHLTVADAASGAPQASIFYVAYTTGADAATRPVTFVLSGGPGDDQGGLHIGSYAPRRVLTNVPSADEPASPTLVDNPETLLDKTDLVFLDEVGTGWSEAIAPNTNLGLRGVDPDVAIYRGFITRWLATNQRIASPTFLLGHSYGTVRAAMLANQLPPAGVNLRGVVLESAVLDFNHNCDVYAALQVAGSCAASLPTFAAIAAYHGRAVPAPPDLPSFLQAARDFDDTRYAPALAAWLGTQAAPDAALTAQLAADTGIAADTWAGDLALTNTDFRTLFMPGKLLGRTDARVVAAAGSTLPQDDPAGTMLAGAFSGAFENYVRGELGYTSASAYGGILIDFTNWPATHAGQDVPDFIPDLAAAIARDPRLPVLALAGDYDLATPFHQAELDLARLGVNPNIQIRHYAAGHDIYLDNQARPLVKADLAAFYDHAAAP